MLKRIGVSDKWSKVFDAFLIAFALIGCAQLFSWMDRTLPVTVHYRVIQTISVPPNGEFRYLNFFTRTKFCETMVERWFVGSDEVIRRIDPLPSAMPTEGLNMRQMSQAKIKVPRDMPPGVSKSCFKSTWMCNPLQRLWPLEGPETCIDFLVKPPPAMSYRSEGSLPAIRVSLESEP